MEIRENLSNTASSEQLLDPAGLARALGKSKSWLYTAVEQGKVPHYRIGGSLRFYLSEVLAEMKVSR